MDIKSLLDRLPPIIARVEVQKLLGGVICSKTLANADSLGTGPKGRIKIGRRVAYDTQELLTWLESKNSL